GSGIGGGGGAVGGGFFGAPPSAFIAGGGGSSTTGTIDDGSDTGSSDVGSSDGNSPVTAHAGSSLSNPITPDSGTTFIFHYAVTPGGLGETSPLYFDPPLESGYIFEIISGPNFASVEVPIPVAGAGGTQFTLTF